MCEVDLWEPGLGRPIMGRSADQGEMADMTLVEATEGNPAPVVDFRGWSTVMVTDTCG